MFPAQQGPQAGPPQMTPEQIAEFYRSVGIGSSVGQPPTTRTVQALPVTLPPMPERRPDRYETIATYPTVQPQREQIGVSDMARGFTPDLRERLPSTPMAGQRAAALPPIPGPYSVASLTGAVNEQGFPVAAPGMPSFPMPAMVGGASPVMTAEAKIAPIPMPPYRSVGSQVDLNPPLPRGRPMRSGLIPPMPIPMPGRAQNPALPQLQRTAPIPQPRPQIRPPLNILVQGSNSEQPQQQAERRAWGTPNKRTYNPDTAQWD